jgi:hypothetical protein
MGSVSRYFGQAGWQWTLLPAALVLEMERNSTLGCFQESSGVPAGLSLEKWFSRRRTYLAVATGA